MNDLSWFLYLAEVIPNVGAAAGIYIFVVGTFGSIGIVIWFVLSNIEDEIQTPPIKIHIIMLALVVLVAIIIPSKETIYLIAGSEAGEAVVTSPEGQEIINDIRLIIKGQLSELKP